MEEFDVLSCRSEPSCYRCHETPWGDACKSCRAGNYSRDPDDQYAKDWESKADWIHFVHVLTEAGYDGFLDDVIALSNADCYDGNDVHRLQNAVRGWLHESVRK